MNTITPAAEATVPHFRPDIDQKVGPAGAIIFTGLLAIGLLFTGQQPRAKFLKQSTKQSAIFIA